VHAFPCGSKSTGQLTLWHLLLPPQSGRPCAPVGKPLCALPVADQGPLLYEAHVPAGHSRIFVRQAFGRWQCSRSIPLDEESEQLYFVQHSTFED
jgi:hypothetical protein